VLKNEAAGFVHRAKRCECVSGRASPADSKDA
jgi:hypothetical protein